MTVAPKREDYDVVVIGAGPAGLAAAATSAEAGLSTLLLDENIGPGGQVFRAISSTPVTDRNQLGADYWVGADLVQSLRASRAEIIHRATVWSLDRNLEIAVSIGGASAFLKAQRVILATGALERPFPIPGWTLPGVMAAGAAQILFKTAALVPSQAPVLAGCGPLLYLLAWQLLNAGARVSVLLDTTPRGRLTAALPDVARFVASPYFVKGMKLVAKVRSQVPVVRHIDAIAAEGSDRLERVRYRLGNRERVVPAGILLLHQGVVPNINLASAIGCEHQWDDRLHCFVPRLDAWGASSVQHVWIAGDGGGIQGARAAEARGRLAALAAANAIGRIDVSRRDSLALPHRRVLERERAGRRFIDTLFAPPRQFRVPEGDTIVCRCEEVTAQHVREAVALGCPGPNQLKAFLRCGMGPCQGRMCGLTVVDLIAQARGVSPQEVGYYRLRFPIKPLTLGELATLPQTEASRAAVIRLRK